MKILVFGRNKDSVATLKKEVKRNNCKSETTKPEMIISLGGDGTFLLSERKYPGIPKLLLRDSEICKKCSKHEFDEIFEKLKSKKFRIEKHIKLETRIKGQILKATNDITIRNKLPTGAIRFNIFLNNQKKYDTLIGDGIVASTPFGSTGYYYSITKNSFSWGMGLAFNNTTKKVRPLVLDEEDKVIFQLQREDAVLVFDNYHKIFQLKPGEKVTIKKSKSIARVVKIE